MKEHHVLLVNKSISLSPLQAITKLREKCPEHQASTLGYAGRLDPMAEGLLLVLIDDENKKRKTYEKLNKSYEFEMLLGVETDTYDVMGLIGSPPRIGNTEINEALFNQTLQTFVGTFEQHYPPYSSARVQGKPLYFWARAGKLDQIVTPSKMVEVFDIKLNSSTDITTDHILETVISRVSQTVGEFRQKEIITHWRNWADEMKKNNISTLPLYNCTATVSSGTYIRSICHELGRKLRTPSIAYSIKRTHVGPYSLTADTIKV